MSCFMKCSSMGVSSAGMARKHATRPGRCATLAMGDVAGELARVRTVPTPPGPSTAETHIVASSWPNHFELIVLGDIEPKAPVRCKFEHKTGARPCGCRGACALGDGPPTRANEPREFGPPWLLPVITLAAVACGAALATWWPWPTV